MDLEASNRRDNKMFGLKKKGTEKTFIDGIESKPGELPVPRPADAPALGPSPAPAQELSHQPEGQRVFECEVCRDYGWYCDTLGVCHNCPRCNPKSLKIPHVKEVEPDYEAEAEEAHLDRPKSNLNKLVECKKCHKRNEIHRMKKKFKCESCGLDQEV